MSRQCGVCSACCTLLPVKEIGKPASQRCNHQRHGKGCMIYRGPGFPTSCRYWTCRWLTGKETQDLSRPDRAGYVIDVQPDFIKIRDNDTGAVRNVEVVQIWVNPKRRDAYKDQRLYEYLSRRADEGVAALIRYGSHEGFVLFAPQLTGEATWIEAGGVTDPVEHTVQDIVEALGPKFAAVDLSKGDDL